MLPDLRELSALVMTVAVEELIPRFAEVQRYHKADGSVVTAADLALQARLQEELASRWPQFRLLSEEMDEPGQHALLSDRRGGLWCLDPLDGTSNFAAGLPFFSVSLGLLIDGLTRLGVVCDPVRGERFTAAAGRGAWLNDEPLRVTEAGLPLRRSIAVVDFKRLPRSLAGRLVADPPFGSQRNFGSCALEWCWLAASRFHVYLHGGQKLWDHAAGHLILREAGGHACTVKGGEIAGSSLEPQSAMAAVDAPLFEAWSLAVGTAAQ